MLRWSGRLRGHGGGGPVRLCISGRRRVKLRVDILPAAKAVVSAASAVRRRGREERGRLRRIGPGRSDEVRAGGAGAEQLAACERGSSIKRRNFVVLGSVLVTLIR